MLHLQKRARANISESDEISPATLQEGFHTPSAKVHISYDSENPPAHPGANWTRFVCISDTHSRTFSVPSGDVLLHSGDLSRLGREDEIRVTIEWLRGLDHGVKMYRETMTYLSTKIGTRTVTTAFTTRRKSSTAIRNLVDNEANRDRGLIYLQDKLYTFRTKEGGREWSVYGSPWQPYFGGWAFNYMPEEAASMLCLPLLPSKALIWGKTSFATIPEVDILLTHGPPYKVLDTTFSKIHAGCPELLAHLSKMQSPPLLHVFGHIHEARGAVRYPWSQGADEGPSNVEDTTPPVSGVRETIMVNAANQPLGRQAIGPGGQRIPCGGPGFQPIIVDLLDSAMRPET
ncbi:Metallo-dependent phosphatase-like protein [Suillus ampliporus]|nr:Metallo-dependent phosphatase-like protein [Suillus ampliporus]